jgi:hypothetical protein
MRKKWWIILVAPPAMVLFGWLFGELVMHLWNWLMPMLFGLRLITFWQSLGLLVLCRILIGGLGGGGGSGSKRRRRASQRWECMTPEEQDRFREWTHRGRGDMGASPTGTPTGTPGTA